MISYLGDRGFILGKAITTLQQCMKYTNTHGKERTMEGGTTRFHWTLITPMPNFTSREILESLSSLKPKRGQSKGKSRHS